MKKKKKRLLCPNNVRTVPTLTRLPRGRAARSTECEHLFPLGRSKLFRDVVLRQLQLTQPHTQSAARPIAGSRVYRRAGPDAV